MKKDSSIVDIYSETANMYGCEPCPKCNSRFRCMFNDKPDIIQCDDCGYNEKGTVKSID
jgi:hypothetical protein